MDGPHAPVAPPRRPIQVTEVQALHEKTPFSTRHRRSTRKRHGPGSVPLPTATIYTLSDVVPADWTQESRYKKATTDFLALGGITSMLTASMHVEPTHTFWFRVCGRRRGGSAGGGAQGQESTGGGHVGGGERRPEGSGAARRKRAAHAMGSCATAPGQCRSDTGGGGGGGGGSTHVLLREERIGRLRRVHRQHLEDAIRRRGKHPPCLPDGVGACQRPQTPMGSAASRAAHTPRTRRTSSTAPHAALTPSSRHPPYLAFGLSPLKTVEIF